MKRQIIQTRDGSPSFFVPEINETYHSRQGAITESLYVYIEQGLKYISNKTKTVNILEFGLGTGLNVLLSLEYAMQTGLKINYTSVEKFPLKQEEFSLLNYETPFNTGSEMLQQIHQHNWNESIVLNPAFTFEKIKGDFAFLELPGTFHLIYYDAFAPSRQAEVWEQNYLEKAYNLLAEGGILVTYCSQGAFKRKLKITGFKVETLQGPPGKKEMVRAVKIKVSQSPEQALLNLS